jgi:hypothetical protein
LGLESEFCCKSGALSLYSVRVLSCAHSLTAATLIFKLLRLKFIALLSGIHGKGLGLEVMNFHFGGGRTLSGFSGHNTSHDSTTPFLKYTLEDP